MLNVIQYHRLSSLFVLFIRSSIPIDLGKFAISQWDEDCSKTRKAVSKFFILVKASDLPYVFFYFLSNWNIKCKINRVGRNSDLRILIA